MPALFDLQDERTALLRRWQAVFERDGNKAAAWRCYRLARAWKLPVPASVLGELDRIATALDEEVDRARAVRCNPDRGENDNAGLGSDRVGRIVTEAGRGSTDPAAALLAWERDFEIASAVGVLRASGLSEAKAVERVAAGTTAIAYGVRVLKDTVSFGPVPTPILHADLIRRAVRRVRDLSTDMTETANLM